MRIYDLRVHEDSENIKLSVSIDSYGIGKQSLWFSTKNKYAKGVCKTRFDAFLVGMLFPAMKYGEDILVEGCVSGKLIFNINNYVIPLISSFSPSCKRIQVTAEQISEERFEGEGIGTGFSGGIDSFCTIYDHYVCENNPDYKINSLLFLNVGSHGFLDEAKVQKKFRARYQYLKQFPEEIGLDFIPVDSNLYLFHPWGHQKTHTLTSVSGILFMQKLFSRYYYASAGLNYKDAISNADNY